MKLTGFSTSDCTTDMWDPNTWTNEPYEYRIYGNDNLSVYALVDEADYHLLIKYKWTIVRKRKVNHDLLYLRRNYGEWSNGIRIRSITTYLHIEVMKNSGVPPPSPEHVLVDHENRNTLDCRRANLRWATYVMSNGNRRRWAKQ